MDQNDTFEDQGETSTEIAEYSLGKEIAKTFAVSTASSAGVIAGFLVVGLAVGTFNDFMKARKAKKIAAATTDTPTAE